MRLASRLVLAVVAALALVLAAVVAFVFPIVWSLINTPHFATSMLLIFVVVFAAGVGLSRVRAKTAESSGTVKSIVESVDLQQVTDALASINQRLELLEGKFLNELKNEAGKKQSNKLEDLLAEIMRRSLESGGLNCFPEISLDTQGNYIILGKKWSGKIHIDLKPAAWPSEHKAEVKKEEVVEERLF